CARDESAWNYPFDYW
nr:immunoglobulin heavy chain junction region [Macaca mulatta]MOX63804.1 immunoglobulin heavy chain junction region [Macaca mulatta]MOX64975.1 immunoglobulin heavy chain junction region [Macaca mulatta]MOX65973.1 immunoglobulin heavy chain junction region [Macaca mulatta]MOX68046.1 immunoglobulin heavy chain junction region [Macaca mulatta]